jgi:hypothetical protein
MRYWAIAALGFLHYSAFSPSLCVAQSPAPAVKEDPVAAASTPPEDEIVLPAPKLPPPPDAKKMPDPDKVWVDRKNRLVYVDGYVSLREGFLEMFACTAGTKEHESVVAVESRAATVHAALLAVGAVDGDPVQHRPEFKPPTGTEIEIEVRWLDDKGEWQHARAQDWVRHARTKKPMEQPWVFGGSMIYKDEETGKEYYMAEGGELICVSNFATATLDIPIESTDSDDALSFEANTEQIPPLGMPVRLVLKPKLEKEAAKAAEAKGSPGAKPDPTRKPVSPPAAAPK